MSVIVGSRSENDTTNKGTTMSNSNETNTTTRQQAIDEMLATTPTGRRIAGDELDVYIAALLEQADETPADDTDAPRAVPAELTGIQRIVTWLARII